MERANRAAHDQLVLALKGKSDVNSPGRVDDQGNVFLNLGPVADRIKQGLVAEGMTFANSLPSVNASIQIAHLDSFQEARTIVLWLDPAATWLPWATLLIAALALLIAQDRRRTLLTIGIGVAVSMLLAATVVFAVRPILINGILTSAIPRSAAVYLYDTVVHPLVVYLAVVFAGGVALVIGALLAGPISARLAPSHPFKRGRPRLGGGSAGLYNDVRLPHGSWPVAHGRCTTHGGLLRSVQWNRFSRGRGCGTPGRFRPGWYDCWPNAIRASARALIAARPGSAGLHRRHSRPDRVVGQHVRNAPRSVVAVTVAGSRSSPSPRSATRAGPSSVFPPFAAERPSARRQCNASITLFIPRGDEAARASKDLQLWHVAGDQYIRRPHTECARIGVRTRRDHDLV